MNNEELIREKALRKLNAGLYARSVWPEDQAFYMTHSFTLYVCGCHFSYGLSSSSCLESKESFHALHSL